MADQRTGEQPGSAAVHKPVEDKTVAAVLGEAVWLMGRSARHREVKIGDLDRLLLPALLLRQFRMFYEGEQPVALVLYAFLSAEAEAGLEAGAPGLQETDWRSGDRAWIVDVVAPFGVAEAFVEETRETVLAGHTVRFGRHAA